MQLSKVSVYDSPVAVLSTRMAVPGVIRVRRSREKSRYGRAIPCEHQKEKLGGACFEGSFLSFKGTYEG